MWKYIILRYLVYIPEKFVKGLGCPDKKVFASFLSWFEVNINFKLKVTLAHFKLTKYNDIFCQLK